MSVLDKFRLDTLWRIISQVDVNEIQEDSLYTFHLLVVADDLAAANQLASALSDAEAGFIHPWITTVVAPIEPALERTQVDIALVLSSTVDLSEAQQGVYRNLAARQIPTVVVIYGEAGAQPGAEIARRGETARVAVTAFEAETVSREISKAILGRVSPKLELALPRRLPPLRRAAFEQLITETANANATYAFTTGLAEIIPVLDIPLNVSDLIVLTKNQLIMAYKIALIAGKEGSPQHLIGEILGVLGGGFLFRQLARELVGLVPVWGIAPKVAVSYAGTRAIGQAVVLWAVEGQQLNKDSLQKLYSNALVRGRQVASQLTRSIRDRLPGRPSSPARLLSQDRTQPPTPETPDAEL